jgi:hypothetical protein
MIPETDRLRIELHIGSSALVSTAAHEQGHARLPDSNRWLRRWRYRTFCNWPQSQQLLHFAFAFLGILLAPRKKKKQDGTQTGCTAGNAAGGSANWLWGLQERAVLALAASGHFCDLEQTRQTASSPNRTRTNHQLRATNARYHLQKDLSLKTRHWAVLKNSRSDYTSDLKRNAYRACPLEELQEAQLFLNTQRCSSMWRHTQGSVVSEAFTRDLTVSARRKFQKK